MSRKPLHNGIKRGLNNLENRAGDYYQCPECHSGILRLQYITYFTWLNDELITVPNFPAWICDICGNREYDPKAIIWLNTLINHEARTCQGYVQSKRENHSIHQTE